MDISVVNLIAAFIVVCVMFGVWVNASISGSPKSLNGQDYFSTTVSFLLFGATWLCTVLLYFILWILKSVTDNTVALSAIRLFDSIPTVLLLGSAIAYSSGKTFNLRVTGKWLAILFGAHCIWICVWWALGRYYDDKNMFLAAMAMAPDLVISSIAIVAIGWVFFVRWGGTAGWLYLLSTITYAILQCPAFIKFGLKPFLKDNIAKDLDLAFSFLAGGKLLLAFGFILLIWHPRLPERTRSPTLDVTKRKLWFTKSVALPKPMRQLIGWPATAVASLLLSALSEPLKSEIAALLKSAIPH